MRNLILPLLLLCSILVNGQSTVWITNLDNAVQETSGLIVINQKLISHNDSGGEPALYEIDTTNGQISRKVIVSNATNVDWEDITADQTYIYIGDFGNNQGSRTNLKIYRVAISDYLSTSNDSVLADTITFSYSNQTSFSPANMATNFDAEAFVAVGDSLYIFTKNWKNSWTNVYSMYNQPGNYSIHKKDSLDVKGFITGAAYNSTTQSIMLIGYNILLSPFVLEISGFNNGSFTNAVLNKKQLSIPSSHSRQTEGICHLQNDEYLISAEASQGKSAALFYFDMSYGMSISDLDEERNVLYPNPVSNILHIHSNEIIQSEIYNESGLLLLKSNQQDIDVSALPSGSYILITLSAEGKAETNTFLIK